MEDDKIKDSAYPWHDDADIIQELEELEPSIVPPLVNHPMAECVGAGRQVKAVGRKDDEYKLRYDLEPTDVRREVIAVYTYGAQKYTDRNWELGIKYGRLYAATRRHIEAFWSGENIDKETGLHHLAHAICELEFMLAFELRKNTGLDNRPKLSKSRKI